MEHRTGRRWCAGLGVCLAGDTWNLEGDGGTRSMNRCTLLLAPIAAAVAVVMCARIVVEVMVTAVQDAIVGDPVRREAEIGAALTQMWGA